MGKIAKALIFVLLAAVPLAAIAQLMRNGGASSAVATLHYAPNGNFPSGSYALTPYGFNLADATAAQAASLPAGVLALVWIGDCSGTGSGNTFVAKLPSPGNPKIWGYQLTDTSSSIPSGCTPTLIAQESDYIHTNDPGKKTYIWMENLTASTNPSFTGWSIAATHLDYIGVGPYPCRSELNAGAGGCWLPGGVTYPGTGRAAGQPDEITSFVNAAVLDGIPKANIIPSFQAFCCGGWTNDRGGSYIMPTPTQAQTMLNTWASALAPAAPGFDYTYSWGVQNSDQALSTTPALQPVFCAHNGVSC